MPDLQILRIAGIAETDLPDEPAGQSADRVACAGVQVREAASLEQAMQVLRASSVDSGSVPIELVVLDEPYPGRWNDKQLAELRAAAPLARFVRVSGPWCEGQQRSGRPPGGTVSIYWHQAAGRWGREQLARSNGQSPSWSLPPTATAEERLLATQPYQVRHPSNIVLCGSTHAAMDALSMACRQGGHETSTASERNESVHLEARAVVWDAMPEALHDAERIGRLRRRFPQAALVAIAGFVRPHDVAAARQLGVAAVLAKPLLVADLLWQLDVLLNTDPMRPATHAGPST